MDEFRNQIICGDCIELLGSIKEPFADLVFADPPFNIGYQYDKYQDTLKKDKYLHWTRDWMAACALYIRTAWEDQVLSRPYAYLLLCQGRKGLHL
ncbi:MAG: DNA methyltransferase [Planctomycetota bacterium]|jgi:DNA modification methylase